MARPTPLSGFPELLPAQRVVEQQVIDTLRRTFELHGFAGIETRAVEPLDQLLRKGDDLQGGLRAAAAAGEESADGHAGLGLHFDLTVPFARYVLEHAGKLEFPFRRYQIQRAWRGERPQEGRYREFTQADVDIVGRDELPFHHDVEVMRVMVEALAALPLPPVSFQFNNRKLIQGFYRGLGIEDVTEAIRIIDKLDKLPADEVAAQLVERVGRDAGAGRAVPRAGDHPGARHLLRRAGPGARRRGRAARRGPGRAGRRRRGVPRGARQATGSSVEANLRIARGLDYYTGTVVEIYMSGYERLKSVGGGGRYDALADDGRTTYPGVGRLLRRLPDAAAADRRRRARRQPAGAERGAGRAHRRGVAAGQRARSPPRLRARGIAVRGGRQRRRSSASRSGSPNGAASRTSGSSARPRDGHEVKDIRSGEQVAADPDTWTPPAEDLHPQHRHHRGAVQ